MHSELEWSDCDLLEKYYLAPWSGPTLAYTLGRERKPTETSIRPAFDAKTSQNRSKIAYHYITKLCCQILDCVKQFTCANKELLFFSNLRRCQDLGHIRMYMWIRKEAVVAYSNYYGGICLEDMRKNTKIIIQDSRCPSENSNRVHPKYKSRALPLYQLVRQLVLYLSVLIWVFHVVTINHHYLSRLLHSTLQFTRCSISTHSDKTRKLRRRQVRAQLTATPGISSCVNAGEERQFEYVHKSKRCLCE